jgi:uncharacterized protein (DUF2461 family)
MCCGRTDGVVCATRAASTEESPPSYSNLHEPIFRSAGISGAWILSPYGETEGGTAHYFHLSSDGLAVLSGYYRMMPDQIVRFRGSVADARGETLPELIASVGAQGLAVEHGGHEPLKRVPRPYPADQPRGDLLKWKRMISGKEFGAPAWLHTPEVKQRIVETWEAAAPLNAWLERHVGPSRVLPLELRQRAGV